MFFYKNKYKIDEWFVFVPIDNINATKRSVEYALRKY